MSLARNFLDLNVVPKSRTRNLVSTITGALVLLISGLSLFGILTAEQAVTLTQYVTTIVTAVAGVIGLFFVVDPPTTP